MMASPPVGVDPNVNGEMVLEHHQHQQHQHAPQLATTMVDAPHDDESTVVSNNINPMFLFKSNQAQHPSGDMVYLRPNVASSSSRNQNAAAKYRNINPNKIDEEQDELFLTGY